MSATEDEQAPLMGSMEVGTVTPKTLPRVGPHQSPWFTYAFTINFIVGAGVLGMPYAFEKAGLGLAVAFLVLASVCSTIAMSWVVEIVCRVQALQVGGVSPLFHIYDRDLQLNEYVQYVLGSTGRRVYEVSVAMYSLGAMWLYVAVFSSSFLAAVPLPGITHGHSCDIQGKSHVSGACTHGYLIYCCVFLLVMLPLAIKGLQGQVRVQVALTILAIVCMLVMIITTTVAIFKTPYSSEDGSKSPFVSKSSLIKLGGFSKIFSTAIFAQLATHGVPNLLKLTNNKKSAPRVFIGALSTTGVMYVALGVVTSLYFGSATKTVVTLNWKNYTGENADAPGWATAVKYIIVLFPTISVSAAFPLYAVTLAETLCTSVPLHLMDRWGERTVLTAVKVVVVLIPFLGALVERDVSLLLQFCGLFGFLFGFLIPAATLLRSRDMCTLKWGDAGDVTPFTHKLSSRGFLKAMMVVSVLLLITAVVNIIVGFAT